MHLHSILKTLAESFFPALCIYCGKEGDWLCKECDKKAESFPHAVCPACNARAIDGELEDSCTEKTGLTRFFCAYPLKNTVVRALVHTYKYRYSSTLHSTMSDLLTQWLKNQNADSLFAMNYETLSLRHPEPAGEGSLGLSKRSFADARDSSRCAQNDNSEFRNFVIVPVPLHKARFNARGFNQSELLARDFSQRFNLQFLPDTLIRTKNTPSQLEVSNKTARGKNMKGAFKVLKNDVLKGSRVILIDDVYTSGATMRECATALRQAGAREVWGVAFARG